MARVLIVDDHPGFRSFARRVLERAGFDVVSEAPSGLAAVAAVRELILGLMAEGRSNQAICQRLFLTEKTVESHVRNIFTKLNLLPATDDNRRVLAVLANLRSP